MPTAKRDLYIGLALARPAGSKVRKEDVEKYGWEDGVEADSTAKKRESAEAKKDADK